MTGINMGHLKYESQKLTIGTANSSSSHPKPTRTPTCKINQILKTLIKIYESKDISSSAFLKFGLSDQISSCQILKS